MRGKFCRKISAAVVASIIASLIAAISFVSLSVQPAAAIGTQAAQAGSQPWCKDYLIVGVAGSGQEGYGTEVGTAVAHLKQKIAPPLEVREIILDYPAAGIEVLLKDLTIEVASGNWDYFESVGAGHVELVRQLGAASIECPNERWILVGYSQGALVINQAASSFSNDANRIFGVLLIGNPTRSPFGQIAERQNFGNAAPGFGISVAIPAYRANYYPWELEHLTTEVCMEADPVCDYMTWFTSNIGPFGYTVHTTIPEILITQAADSIIERVYHPRLPIPPTSGPTVEAAGPGAVKVSWEPFKEDNAPITKYTVLLGSPGSAGQVYAEVNPATHSATIRGLTGDSILTATIHAYVTVNGGPGRSHSLPSDPITVPAVPAVPLSPAAPIASLEAPSSLSVSWSAPESNGAEVTGYEVSWHDGENVQSRRVAAAPTSTTISGLVGDRAYTATVAAIAAGGGVSAASEPSNAVYVPVAEGILTPAPVPTITGTVKAGFTLTANPGTWGPSPVTFGYQWLRSGAAITGATAKTFALTGADTGKTITVRMTATKPGYATAVKTSLATAAVAAGTLAAPVPTITGTRKVAYTLTANPGTWSPAPVTLRYQWYRSGVAITGATAKTYILSGADAGKLISTRVTGAKTGYTSVTKASAATATIAAGTLAAPIPTVTGTKRVGYVLTANPGTWTAGTTLRYQWYRSGIPIAGATGKTYRLVAADRYDTMKARVVGSKPGYVTAVKVSASTVRVS